MSAIPGLPSRMAVREMLMDILDREVSVAPSKPWAPSPFDPGAVAVYLDDGMRLRALIACNLELSVALGASIALIPRKAAADCVDEGRMTDDMIENLNEVVNILAALFNLPERPHVKLYALHVPGMPLPADIAAQLRVYGKREDLKVEVAGYPAGRLSLVLV
jgi:hypothetical protein